MENFQDFALLKKKALSVRRQVLEMIACAGKGHIGGSLSCVEIITTLYLAPILNHNPGNPSWQDRDRFILSKGHAAATLYAVLAECGYLEKEKLCSYQKEKCSLLGHPDRRTSGIEIDSGSLGHGLGIATGIALGAMKLNKDYFTFALLGDGECHEGTIWEAALFAAQHNLYNLIGIIDHNQLCVTDFLRDCISVDPLAAKWQAFGWEVQEVDGHSIPQLMNVCLDAKKKKNQKPLMIIAHTIKGKGVSFMENKIEWHHRVPKKEELEQARDELK